MSKEILKDYTLINDVARLNHKEYYFPSFDTPEIFQHFGSISNINEVMLYMNSCRFFMENLVYTKDKDVYLILKWLITVHKLLKKLKNPYVIEVICQNICNLQEIPFQQKYQKYINEKLVRPYLQFLRKLGLLKVRQLVIYTEEKQNIENNNSVWFIQLNLIKYGLKQFQVPCRQFYGFFSECYPFLANFSTLIYEDLNTLLNELRKQLKIEQSIPLTQLDLFECQRSLQSFPNQASQAEHFLSSPIVEEKVSHFFESDSKPEIKTLQFIDY